MISLPFKSSRALGVASEPRRFDLPLDKRIGSEFMVLLIGMMSFLAVIFALGLFIFHAMVDHWTSGLENKLTVEIPAQSTQNDIIPQDDLDKRVTRMADILQNQPYVEQVNVLSRQDVTAMVAPWIGQEEQILDTVPLPRLISVTLNSKRGYSDLEDRAASLRAKLEPVSANVRVDTHKSWLNDLLSTIRAMQVGAGLMTLIIIVIMIIAVSGAVRARLAVHHDELELLHLMGASDSYITRQFQIHSLIHALKGTLAGSAAALLFLGVLQWLGGGFFQTLAPQFNVTGGGWAVIFSLPLLLVILSVMTARHTTLLELRKLP